MFSLKVTEELELRLLEYRHAPALFDLIDGSREFLVEWQPWIAGITSVEDAKGVIRSGLQALANNTGFRVGIWFKGELAGVIGCNFIDWTSRSTDLGYWLGAQFQGHGLVIQSCRVLLNYTFGELGLNRVEISTALENLKSRAVAEKLGFKQEGIIRQYWFRHERYFDKVIYSLLAEEWQLTTGQSK
jgi:ribosomal-protein-serine acetyltransferase